LFFDGKTYCELVIIAIHGPKEVPFRILDLVEIYQFYLHPLSLRTSFIFRIGEEGHVKAFVRIDC
jgi:hypothetical protein